MKFSFSLLFTGLFLAYVIHSIWSIVQIFIPPKCTDKYCLKSYLTENPKLQLILCTTYSPGIQSYSELNLVKQIQPFEYKEEFIRNISIPITRKTRNNGSLYLHAFAAPMPRTNEDNWMKEIQSQDVIYSSFALTEYLIPEANTFNLLNNKEEKPTIEHGEREKAVAHITKKIRLTMLTDLLILPKKNLPEDFPMFIRIKSSDTYFPPMRFDKFSNRLRDYIKINSSDRSYDLEFEFTSISIGNLRMALQFEGSMSTMRGFGFSLKDLDEVKGIFSDTNVYLLALTLFVASIHLLFDFLAFKNDVIYWKGRKTTVGLSSKTILWRCFSQIVVFFYLLEEKSSLIIIIPGGIGAIIEIWKVTKAFKVSFSFRSGISFGMMSDSEKNTAKHDDESMKYLSYLIYPLCLGGAVYSLLYTPHKSWYSWTIQSLVNGVYAFGFLFMLPQLFVNYRLKSVAHLPWRAFMYKAFNTFIDDLFAFIITMPTAHRVACFRDDIVFIIYLYQRWLYPVDKKRIDGGGDYEFEAEETKDSKKTD